MGWFIDILTEETKSHSLRRFNLNSRHSAIQITLTHHKYAVTNNAQSDSTENHQFLRWKQSHSLS